MNIRIKDKVGLNQDLVWYLVGELLKNRKPYLGSFNYGLETHGVIGLNFVDKLSYPIQVRQTNKRVSDSSVIEITIEKHVPFF